MTIPPPATFAMVKSSLLRHSTLALGLASGLALLVLGACSPKSASNQVTPNSAAQTFTVSFNTDGGSSVSSQMITKGGKAVPPSPAPKRAGHTFVGWFTSAATNIAFNFSAPISNAVTVYASWQRQSYTVTFLTNAGAPAFGTQTVLYTNKVSQPGNPSRAGYNFEGWYTDSAFRNAFSFTTAITGALTLYASWQRQSYTVTFNTGTGGSSVASQSVKHSSSAEKPSPDPARTGYDFVDWFTTAATNVKFDFSAGITKNTAVYAGWKLKTYTVTFLTNVGAPAFATQKVLHTNRVSQPSNPSRASYNFGGWYTDSTLRNAFSFTTAITGNLTLYAKWNVIKDFDTLIAAGNNNPYDIWSGGTTMWAVDWSDDKIYAYRMSDKTHDSSKNFNTLVAGNDNPTGMWSDGTTMWVADLDSDKIYAYRMSDKRHDSSKDFTTLTLSAAGNRDARGLWSDGTTMWVSDSGDDKLYAYNLGTKARDSSKDFNTLSAAGNGNPSGLWSDGTTMWVADYIDGKIYAYRLSDKARDSDKDFDTLSAAKNNNPYGIWSDGTTMWVSDYNDGKIYAYSLRTKVRTP